MVAGMTQMAVGFGLPCAAELRRRAHGTEKAVAALLQVKRCNVDTAIGPQPA